MSSSKAWDAGLAGILQGLTHLERDSARGGIAKAGYYGGADEVATPRFRWAPSAWLRLMRIKWIAEKLWMVAEAALFLLCVVVSFQRDPVAFLIVTFASAASSLGGGMFDRPGPRPL
jgi:hypothetical protein